MKNRKEEGIYEYKNGEIRELQLKSLEMFLYVKKICEENNLLIYFCGGCCIGTIRNKGFIPWDDDIDVFMPRKDYEKLKMIWNQKANTEKYECVFPHKGLCTKNMFMTINDNNTTFIKTYQKDIDMNHGIVLDIIPLDGCPTNKIKRNMQKFWALIYSLYCTQYVPIKHGKIVEWLGKIMLWLVPGNNLKYHIYTFAEKQMTKYDIDKCEYVTELCSGPKYMKNQYPKEWFQKSVYKEFEGHLMPIPVGYDKYLRTAFGDYMQLPPKEKRIPEHNVVMCDTKKSYKKYKGIYYCVKKEERKVVK